MIQYDQCCRCDEQTTKFNQKLGLKSDKGTPRGLGVGGCTIKIFRMHIQIL